MTINEHGETVYSEEEANEIKLALKRFRETYKALGQNTSRTLIDCMNRYLTHCPLKGYAIHTTITNKGTNLSFLSKESELVFQINDCPNIECCYKELLGFIVEKAFPEKA